MRKPRNKITEQDVQRLLRDLNPQPHWSQLTDQKGKRMAVKRD